VRYCFTVRIAVTRSGVAVSHPIFQPVVRNVLPPDEIDTVRFRAPGIVAIGEWDRANARCS
jgi:hypothetical protein